MLKLKDISHIKRESGIYALLHKKEIVYIGRSRNVYQRIMEHIIDGVKDFDNVRSVYHSDDVQLDIMEVVIISTLNPKYNKLIIDKTVFIRTLPYSCKDHIPKKLEEMTEFIIDALKYGTEIQKQEYIL